jgi:hypothetical protein
MAEQVVFEAKGIAKVVLQSESRQVFVTWDSFSGGQFKPCLEAQMSVVKAGKAKFVIVDVRKTKGVPTQDDQDFLVKTVFPAFHAGGVQAIVTLVPESAVTKMGAKRWQSSGSQFGFKMYEAGSPEDAESLLASEFPALRKKAA